MSAHGSGKGEVFGDNDGSSGRRSKRDRKPPKRFLDDDIYNQPQSSMAKNKKARNGENACDNVERALVPYNLRVSTRMRQPVKKFFSDEDEREFQLIPGTWNPSAERAARDFYRAKYQPSVNIGRFEITSTTSSSVSNETSGTESETPARRVSTRIRKPVRLSLRDDSSTSSGSQQSKTRKTGKKTQKKKVPKRAAVAKKDAESQTETEHQKNAGVHVMDTDLEDVKGPVMGSTHPKGQQNATDKTNAEDTEKAITPPTEKKMEEQPCCSKSLPKITFDVSAQETVEPVDRPAPREGPEPTNKDKDADKAVDTTALVTEPDVIAVPSNEPVQREPVEPPNAVSINETTQMDPVEPPNAGAINGTAQVDPVEPPNAGAINGTAQMDPVEPPTAGAINGTAQMDPVEAPNAVVINGTAQVDPVELPNTVVINGTAQMEPVEPLNAVVINGEPPNNDISNNVQVQEQKGINGHVVDEGAGLSQLHMELDTQLGGFSFYDWFGLMAIIDRHGQLPKNTPRNETASVNLFCLGPACLIEVVQYINAVWMNANRLALPAPLANEDDSVGQNSPPQELQMEVPRPRYCNGIVYFGPAGVKRVPADQPSIGME